FKPQREDSWYNAIPPQSSDICQNLIRLCLNAHAYWGSAYFARKLIRMSDDKKRLDI
ncbi:uncharacterized protein BDR25DRAFT_224902, partial [Lindgomyces ingoldianus]